MKLNVNMNVNMNLNRLARAAVCAGLLASAALLASCGGSGDAVSNFHATRVLAFGDETSVITADQKKYTVNALLTDGSNAVDCSNNLIWVQVVASIYGLTFPQCPGTAVDPA